MVIVGSGVLQRPDADAIHAAACGIANNVARPQEQGWRTLNILHRVNGGWGGGDWRRGGDSMITSNTTLTIVLHAWCLHLLAKF